MISFQKYKMMNYKTNKKHTHMNIRKIKQFVSHGKTYLNNLNRTIVRIAK